MTESAIGGSWEELEKEIFTPDEILESKLRAAEIGERIKSQFKPQIILTQRAIVESKNKLQELIQHD